MESEVHYYSGCDHWPWSRSLCVVGPILPLVFQGKSKNDAFSGTLSIKAAAAGVFLSKCSAYWWIEIHVSRFRYDIPHYLAFNSHLFLPHNSSLSPLSSLVLPPHFHSHSIISHLFFTPCVTSLCPLPTTSTTLISRYSPPPPPFLHLSFRAQRGTVGTSSPRILISHFVV